MTTRTICQTVYFEHPFRLQGYARTLPAGTYDVEIEELILDTMTARAYRQVQGSMRLPPDPDRPGVEETLTFDPQSLDLALIDDMKPALPAEGLRGHKASGISADIDRAENEGMALARVSGGRSPTHDPSPANLLKT
ncbi:hypothetical protein [Pseudokordiimonas caeni]|uniref:hypothetical protein n=1 Tax=Pseudokordiimonas caeni TaxID=2997908 RepID=UPI0028124C1A|nr:hypothetical protein [Pseudokordiimonas caeni]